MKYFNIIWMLICFSASAQNPYKYSGTIYAENQEELLIGATVSVNNQVVAISGLDGFFSFESDEKVNKLKVSYVGYSDKVIEVSNNTQLSIELIQTDFNLNQVVVTASRHEQERINVPAAIGIFSKSQIEDTKATQIDQMLNQMTGVYMSNLGNESHTMSIRSPLSYKALFLFTQDGVPLRPTGNFSHTALKEMDNASFQRMEIIRGSNSSVYGSEAISGVINAITSKPSRNLSGRFSLQGNNIGHKRGEFNLSNTFGKTGVFIGGHYGIVRNGWRDHSDMDKLGSTFKLTHKATEKLDFSLTTNYIFLESERTGNLDSANFYGKNLTSLHTFTNSKSTAFRLNLQTNYLWNKNNQTRLIIFHRNNAGAGIPHFRIRNNRKDKLKAKGEYRESTLQSYGAILNHTVFMNWLDSQLSFGGSTDFSPTSSMKKRLIITRDGKGRYVSYKDINKLIEDYTVDYINTAAFAQYQLSPVKNLQLMASLRYDNFMYKYASTKGLELYKNLTSDRVIFSNLTPKIGATFNFENNRGIYANYSMGFVPPQIRDIYGADILNRAIKPQIFNNYEAGGWFAFSKSKGYLDLSIYRLEGANELVKVVLPDGTEENRNVGATSHTGVELSFKYKIIRDLEFRFNGSYAIHKYEKYNSGKKNYDGKLMERAPKWIYNTAIQYKPSYFKGFRVGVEMQHLGKYFQSPNNEISKVYSGFDLFHLRAGYEFKGVLKGLEIWTNILNLTDELYAEISDVSAYNGKKRYRPGNPRSFNIGVQYKIGK